MVTRTETEVSELEHVADENGEYVSPATDNYDEASDSVDLDGGGTTTAQLHPPGRATQLSLRVESTGSVEVVLDYRATSESLSSTDGVIEEVLPVYAVSEPVDVAITDQSDAANQVAYDMVVV